MIINGVGKDLGKAVMACLEVPVIDMENMRKTTKGPVRMAGCLVEIREEDLLNRGQRTENSVDENETMAWCFVKKRRDNFTFTLPTIFTDSFVVFLSLSVHVIINSMEQSPS
jgi:hypothetical protein